MRDTNGCLSGKPRYGTRQEAKTALSKVRSRRRSERKIHRKQPMESDAYLCDLCDGHHLTKWSK